MTCDVRFHLFRPKNLSDCPFIIWVSIGEHKHPPPPPTLTPDVLIQGLIKVIQTIPDPTLTTCKSPLLVYNRLIIS